MRNDLSIIHNKTHFAPLAAVRRISCNGKVLRGGAGADEEAQVGRHARPA